MHHRDDRLTIDFGDCVATYYIGSQLASRAATMLAREGSATFDAMDYAYGDSTNLMKVISSISEASQHQPTPPKERSSRKS